MFVVLFPPLVLHDMAVTVAANGLMNLYPAPPPMLGVEVELPLNFK